VLFTTLRYDSEVQRSAFQWTIHISQKHPLLLCTISNTFIFNLIKDSPSTWAPIITLLICIKDAFRFNLTGTDYPGDFGDFPLSFHANSGIVTQITSQLLPSMSFPIYYWLIILPFNAI
jgi:hypothetical protein